MKVTAKGKFFQLYQLKCIGKKHCFGIVFFKNYQRFFGGYYLTLSYGSASAAKKQFVIVGQYQVFFHAEATKIDGQ